MAITEIPPKPKAGADSPQLYEVPVLVIQLQDDLARSRLREAFWISVVVHLLLIITAVTSPKWVNFGKPIAVRTAADLIAGRELTYLDLPHDNQKVEKAPDTNKISDKNRIATTRHPQIDRKTLDDLRDSSRPGPPGAPGMPAPQQPPSQGAQQAQMQPGPPGGGRPQPPPPQAQAKLQQPPAPKPFGQFGGQMTAGSAIEQAARAAASGRTSGYGGAGGDYGFAGNAHGQMGPMEVLSDTQGVDFGPYLARVLHDVKVNWYNIIPEVARPPIMKKGKVAIVFYIMPDGQVRGLELVGRSGDIALDRAAYGGISSSNPFPPLPGDFHGPYLALRFHFFYNPDKNDLQ